MPRFAFACGCCAVLLAACGQSGKSTSADTTATAAPAAAPAPPSLSLNDVAGKWNLKVMNEAGDSTLLTEVLNATATGTGWTLMRPKMKPDTLHPTVSGDSLVTDAGPYPSALRKGLKVTTHSVLRLQGGNLVGVTTAHYNTKSADSVRHFHVEGTKAP